MPTLSTRYWNPQQVTGSAFNPSNSGQGGNGNWNTTGILWSTNGDGTGGTAWTNSTDLSADIGSAIMTLQTNITTGDIVSSNITLTGSYAMTIGYGLSNVTMVADVPVTSSTDTTYGFQCLVNSNLNFKKGFYCNAFHFGVPVIISGSLQTTSTTIFSYIDDSLILNCNADVSGDVSVQNGGSLTISSNKTASFNGLFYTYENITCNGLLELNTGMSIFDNISLSGNGNYNINGDFGGNYNLTKTGDGILFISGTRSDANLKDIIISNGTLKTNSNKTYSNTNFICSGTLSCMGNLTIGGNATFHTGTLRLGV